MKLSALIGVSHLQDTKKKGTMNRSNAMPIESEVVDLKERNWLPRHVSGDADAFAQLMAAYRGFVLTLLWRYGVDHANRDDLFQEIFLRIHQAAASYQPSQALRPWLVTIVLNTLRNHRRDQYRKSRFLSQLFTATRHNRHTQHNPGADQMLEQKSTVLWLESRIKDLPDRQREILVLSTMKDLRMKDIARVMGMPVNTVKTHLRRARLALAEDLQRREVVEK
jgi:RNA polymerase sigma-70 factor (ECF subfamily)